MPIAQIVDVTQVESLFDVSSVSKWDPLLAVVALVLGLVIGRIARAAIRRYGKRSGLAPNLIDLFGTVLLWTIFSISIVIALTLVGFNAAPIWLAILLLGALFVVSGRVILENFGAGVTLQARTPFQPGDEIDTVGVIGRVREVNSRVVIIDTVDGRQVLVPNSQVLRNPIVNFTKHPHRMTALDVSVIYTTRLDEAVDTIEQALLSTDGVLADPEPIVQVTTFDDSGIRIAARFWHLPDILEERAATHEAAMSINSALRDAGIEFAFPQRTLWWGSDTPAQPGS